MKLKQRIQALVAWAFGTLGFRQTPAPSDEEAMAGARAQAPARAPLPPARPDATGSSHVIEHRRPDGDEPSSELLARTSAEIAPLFARNDLADPAIAELLRLGALWRARKLSKAEAS